MSDLRDSYKKFKAGYVGGGLVHITASLLSEEDILQIT